MYTKEEYYYDLRNGRLSGVPKVLYELLHLVMEHGQDVVHINTYERPVKIEDAIRRYSLKGISITNANALNTLNVLFNMHYQITIDTQDFIFNLSRFYDKSEKEVEDYYDWVRTTKRRAEEKHYRKMRKQNPGVVFKRNHPRDTGVVLFRRNICGSFK